MFIKYINLSHTLLMPSAENLFPMIIPATVLSLPVQPSHLRPLNSGKFAVISSLHNPLHCKYFDSASIIKL